MKCGSPGKHPRTPNGVLDATDNTAQIEEWWSRWPQANIGIATGQESDLWVLDIDTKNSVKVGETILSEGEHSLRRLELTNGELPSTVMVETPSGGVHFYFEYPGEDDTWGNRSGVRPSIDVRGHHGYVVAPPSVGLTGQYKWGGSDEIARAPDWLLDVVREEKKGEGLRKLAPDEKIQAGQGRHEYLFKYGSMLRGVHALEGRSLLGALLMENAAVLDPPLEHHEVEHILESVSRYPVNQAPPEFDLEPGEETEEEPLPPVKEGADIAISLYDLVTNPPTPPVPLVAGILNSGEGAILASAPNLGKSWIAFHMALAVATGQPFLGHFETTQGGVLYIDEEGSPYNDYERLTMLMEGAGIGSTDGIPLHLAINKSLRLDKPDGRVAIRRMIERHRPKLVIFDAMVRFHRGDENNAQAMADLFDIPKKLQSAYGCAVLFLHHLRKSGINDDPHDLAERIRGSSDIQGHADATYVLRRGNESTDIQFHTTKQRNGPKFDPFSIGLLIDHEKMSTRLGYRGVLEDDQKNTQHSVNERILEAIKDIEIEKGRATADAIAVKLGRASTTIRPILRGLVNARQIEDYLFVAPGDRRQQTAYRRRAE